MLRIQVTRARDSIHPSLKVYCFIYPGHTHTPNRIQEHPRQTELMQYFCHPFIKTSLAYTSNCGGHRRENQSQTTMEANLFNIYTPSRPSNMARKTIPSIPAAPQRQPPSGTLHAGYLSSHVICKRSWIGFIAVDHSGYHHCTPYSVYDHSGYQKWWWCLSICPCRPGNFTASKNPHRINRERQSFMNVRDRTEDNQTVNEFHGITSTQKERAQNPRSTSTN